MLKDIERFYVFVTTSWWFIPYFILSAMFVVVAGVGWAKWFMMPLIACALFWPAMAVGIRERGCWPTFLKMLFGYAALTAILTIISTWWTSSATAGVWRGAAVFGELDNWARNGAGPFASNGSFIKRELLEYLVLAPLTVATAGAGGVIMTAASVDITAYQAAMFYGQSASPGLTLLLAFSPWWIVKGAAFLFISIALTPPLAAKIFDDYSDPKPRLDFLVYGLAGLVLEIILKVALSGIWQQKLLATLGA